MAPESIRPPSPVRTAATVSVGATLKDARRNLDVASGVAPNAAAS